MGFSTPLSRKLGLKYPIVSAPMFIISNKEMILACAEAGILGTMPSLNARTHDGFRENLEWITKRTDKPFGINMTIGMTDPERLEADMSACEEFRVPVWITSYGDPSDAVQRAHDSGASVFHDVIGLRHARKAAAAGVDALIGVSAGAGGHAGTISPFALFPWLKEETGLPIIGAGGISTGQQLAATFALGAELAYMGTRFITSEECGAPKAYKQMVVDSSPDDIVYTNKISGVNANFMKQTVPDEFEAIRTQEGAARQWVDIWSAGHGVATIDEILPIERIVEDIVREYHDAVAALTR